MELNTTVTPEAIYALRKFKHDNAPYYLTEAPTIGDPATDQEIRDLLIFAARNIGPDLGLPRTLEALRVVHMVPEAVGEALFEGVTP